MNRQQEALALAENLMTDFELSQTTTSKRVLKALRLARLLADDSAQEWLGFEINGVPSSEAGRAWMSTTRRWTDEAEGKGYWGPAAELEAHRVGAQGARTSLAGDVSLSGDLIALAMRERATLMTRHTNTETAMAKVLAAIDAQIYRYASDTYAELRFSEIQASLFEASREAVDGTLATVAGAALNKIDNINERLSRDDSEAISQAMATCRRLIDAVADHLFPPRDEPYDLNGQALNVKQNAVLNRVNAHLHTRGLRGSRADRLRRALSDVYGRVSAGVHSEVDAHEARYLFLATYLLLGEVLTLPDSPPS